MLCNVETQEKCMINKKEEDCIDDYYYQIQNNIIKSDNVKDFISEIYKIFLEPRISNDIIVKTKIIENIICKISPSIMKYSNYYMKLLLEKCLFFMSNYPNQINFEIFLYEEVFLNFSNIFQYSEEYVYKRYVLEIYDLLLDHETTYDFYSEKILSEFVDPLFINIFNSFMTFFLNPTNDLTKISITEELCCECTTHIIKILRKIVKKYAHKQRDPNEIPVLFSIIKYVHKIGSNSNKCYIKFLKAFISYLSSILKSDDLLEKWGIIVFDSIIQLIINNIDEIKEKTFKVLKYIVSKNKYNESSFNTIKNCLISDIVYENFSDSFFDVLRLLYANFSYFRDDDELFDCFINSFRISSTKVKVKFLDNMIISFMMSSDQRKMRLVNKRFELFEYVLDMFSILTDDYKSMYLNLLCECVQTYPHEFVKRKDKFVCYLENCFNEGSHSEDVNDILNRFKFLLNGLCQ